VFLIGMRVNKLWKVHKWVPVMMAMGPMLRELMTHREKGLLGFTTLLGWRGPVLVQYWSSFEQLDAFAKSPDDPHLPAWRRYNRAVGRSGDVGVWHEVYVLGRYEAIYGNMPVTGLAAATSHVPVGQVAEVAVDRLGR
jgi:hypothetical protein